MEQKRPIRKVIPGDCLKPGVEIVGKDLWVNWLDCGEPASFILYEKGSNQVKEEIALDHFRSLGKLRACVIQGLGWKEVEYNFKFGDKICLDPYGKCFVGNKEYGKESDGTSLTLRSKCSMDHFDWQETTNPNIPWEETIMYFLHVRGFTKNRNSGVKKKGTFAGIQEKIPYFKEIGINQIKLMPCYDFSEVPEKKEKTYQNKYLPFQEETKTLNYWGYGCTGRYFAPKTSYSASANPVKEMKEMIRALHQNGIEVILEFYFPQDISTRLAVNAIVYWKQEYQIDGFQIIGNPLLCRTLAKDPAVADTKLLCDYFPIDEIYEKDSIPRVRFLAEYNDGFLQDSRKFLKGDSNAAGAFAARFTKNPAGAAVINYITKHEGFTLQDLVSYDTKHNEENGENNRDGWDYNLSWNCGEEGPSRKKKTQALRLKQMKNALIMLLLGQGTPMLLAGDEFGNSQQGNNNPYCIDGPVTWVDWSGLSRQKILFSFVKELIALRKNWSVLHLDRSPMKMDSRGCGYPELSFHSNQAWFLDFENDQNQLGILYCEREKADVSFIYIACNMSWKEQDFALPNIPEKLEWVLQLDSNQNNMEEEKEVITEKLFQTAPRSIKIITGRKVKQK